MHFNKVIKRIKEILYTESIVPYTVTLWTKDDHMIENIGCDTKKEAKELYRKFADSPEPDVEYIEISKYQSGAYSTIQKYCVSCESEI